MVYESEEELKGLKLAYLCLQGFTDSHKDSNGYIRAKPPDLESSEDSHRVHLPRPRTKRLLRNIKNSMAFSISKSHNYKAKLREIREITQIKNIFRFVQ